MTENPQEIHARLNAETGQIEWSELQRHFAHGSVVSIDPSLDLVDVATRFVNDDSDAIRQWMNSGLLARATDDHARIWEVQRPLFWAVVVAPWVLIQEITRK